MSETFLLHPELRLMPCLTIEPREMKPLAMDGDEYEFGALGIGSLVLPDGATALVLSVHMPDGAARMAVLNSDDCQRMLPVLENALLSSTIAAPPASDDAVN